MLLMDKKKAKEGEELEEIDFPEDDTPAEEEIQTGTDIVIIDTTYENGRVITTDPNAIPQLYEKSFFGTLLPENILELETMEVLMLLERKRIRVIVKGEDPKKEISFEDILCRATKTDERLWTKYLIYRDLRQRGYMVRAGYGDGIDFRVFPRGAAHQEDIAKYFICILAEGDPVQLETLDRITRQTLASRKELILAIIDRLGDPTYYRLEQFKLSMNEKTQGRW